MPKGALLLYPIKVLLVSDSQAPHPIISLGLSKPSAVVPTASLHAAGPSINVTFAEWLP